MSTLHEQLRDTSARLFAERGFAGTSIRDIAAELGVTSAALYHYVGSKEQLLADSLLDLVGRIRATAVPLLAEAATPEAGLGVLLRIDVLFSCRHPTLTIVWENEMRSLGPQARERFMPVYDDYRSMWLRVVADGYADGVFEGPSPEMSVQALKGLCSSVARWYEPGGIAEPEVIADQYLQMALNMLNARRDDAPLTVDSLGLPPASWFSRLVNRTVEGGMVP